MILEPAAVLDIVGFMFWDYSGMAILDQRSFLTGRIGSKLFGDNITIWDDVTHPLQTRFSIRWRRHAAATRPARRKWSREACGLRARDGGAHEALGIQR